MWHVETWWSIWVMDRRQTGIEQLCFQASIHGDVTTWKRCTHNWSFVWGIHRPWPPEDSPCKGPVMGSVYVLFAIHFNPIRCFIRHISRTMYIFALILSKGSRKDVNYIDGLVRDYSNSIANALELLQSCTKPSICFHPQQVMLHIAKVLRKGVQLDTQPKTTVLHWPSTGTSRTFVRRPGMAKGYHLGGKWIWEQITLCRASTSPCPKITVRVITIDGLGQGFFNH